MADLASLDAGDAWALVLGTITFADSIGDLPVWMLVPAGVAGGVLALTALGGGQWIELRRHLRRAGWWIPANAAAWSVGVVSIAAMSPMQEGDPPVKIAAISVFAGALMAATVAVLTGAALVRILRA